jgi:hypothetical protein
VQELLFISGMAGTKAEHVMDAHDPNRARLLTYTVSVRVGPQLLLDWKPASEQERMLEHVAVGGSWPPRGTPAHRDTAGPRRWEWWDDSCWCHVEQKPSVAVSTCPCGNVPRAWVFSGTWGATL